MFAFIDESGNTGRNLFDENQRAFYYAAVISKADLDVTYKLRFAQLATTVGRTDLHAAEMGDGLLDRILPDLQRMIKKDNVRFFISEIEKRTLALTTVADTLFDTGENPSVPWTTYNIRPLRLLTVLKLSVVANDEVLQTFWDALMERDALESERKFVWSLTRMQSRLSAIPDERSRQVIGDAIDWALSHPGAITVHVQKSLRLWHLPHIIVFNPVLHAVQRQSEHWNLSVTEIRHDRESQMASELRKFHGIISRAPVETFRWVDTEIPVGAVPGSSFRIVSSKDSPGIQLADIVLWLFRRERESGHVTSAERDFLKRVKRNGTHYELSQRSMEASVMAELGPIMSMPMDPAMLQKGYDFMAQVEQKRQQLMADYERANAGRS